MLSIRQLCKEDLIQWLKEKESLLTDIQSGKVRIIVSHAIYVIPHVRVQRAGD